MLFSLTLERLEAKDERRGRLNLIAYPLIWSKPAGRWNGTGRGCVSLSDPADRGMRMLDIKFIRENPDAVAKGAQDKKIKFDVERLLELDRMIKPLQQSLETHQAERNRISKEIPKAAKDERQKLIDAVADAKKNMESTSEQLKPLKQEFDQLMLICPQPAKPEVPVGKDDSENVCIRTWGEIPSFSFEPKDHVTLGQTLDIIDIQRGVKLAGSRSYLLKGLGARLEQAMIQYTFDLLLDRGFIPFSVPLLVKEDAMIGTGYFPTGRDQAYCVEKDELALIGTSEVALASLHTGEILEESVLPLRYMASTPCFRREAGTYGKDTHGLYRVHQFHKIEQVIIAPSDEAISDELHAELLANAEAVVQGLELPYQVVDVCTGDLGQGQKCKNDIETWMPSRKGYGETHSCSSFFDFQARRLNLRYKDKDGKKRFCYTLNNTAIATTRMILAVLENYQEADGSVRIPKVLQPYLKGLEVIRPA